jgi:putative spermidine/putrescine transport system substrate-binding protein
MKKNIRNRAMIVVLLVCFLMVGPVSSIAGESKEVVVAVTGTTYEWANDWKKDFEKDTGLTLILEKKWLSGANLKAMGMTGKVVYDVVQSNLNTMTVGQREKVIVPVNYSVFTQKEYADISYRKEFVNKFGVAVISFGRGLAYSTEKYPEGANHPKSWEEFWDAKNYPGRRSISFAWNYAPFEGALMADGVSIEKLYPLDLERAFKSFDRIRPQIQKFAKSSTETVQLLVTGEVDAVDGWFSALLKAAQDGAPIAVEYNQAEFAFNLLSPLKGPNGLDNSMTFIKYAMRPEIQAKLAYNGYGPISKKSLDLLPEKLAKMLPNHADNLNRMFFRNEDWWAETNAQGKTNREVSVEMLNAWMVK